MLHAIVGHTYTKYTHKMHKYTDAQIHTNTQGKCTQNKRFCKLARGKCRECYKMKGGERDEEKEESKKIRALCASWGPKI